jgi:hypothetical protein
MRPLFLLLALWLSLAVSAQSHHRKSKNLAVCQEQTADNCSECCCTPDTTVACYDGKGNNYPGYQKMTPKDIIYDFSTGIFLLPPRHNRLKTGDWVRVRIMHFNPLLFGVSINSKDSSYKTVVDAGNALAFFTSPTNLSSLVAGIQNGVTGPQQAAPAGGGRPGRRITSPTTTAPVVDSIALVRAYLQAAYDTIRNYQQRAVKREHAFESRLHQYNQSLAVLKERYPSCKDFQKVASREFRDSLESFFVDLRTHVDVAMDSIQQLQTAYILGSINFVSFLSSGPFHVADSLIKTYYAASSTYLAKLDSSLSYRSLDSLLLPLRSLKYMKPCFSSGSMLFTKDIKTITLQFRAWTDSAHNYVSNPDPLQLPIIPQKAWGVSAGIYTSTLHNLEYTSKPDATGGTYHLIPDNTGKIEIGVDALAYLGLKSWTAKPESLNFNYFGINYGAGLSLESKPKPRVLLGLGYVYGGANRIVVSGGFIAGFVDRLSAAYSTGTAYTVAQIGYNKQVLRPGAYLSFNYSFVGN